jgi:hypothetical protein
MQIFSSWVASQRSTAIGLADVVGPVYIAADRELDNSATESHKVKKNYKSLPLD